MTQDQALTPELLAQERAVWDALVRGDAQTDAAALSDDFTGVYPDGIFGKPAHVAQLAAGPTVADYTLSEVQSRPLGPNHALLIYHATYRRPGAAATEAMYVSSIWQRSGHGWINIFSQDTPDNPNQAVR
ncbi:MAG: nuclear transport factor 2 family protein [Pseudomonadota bacterium]